MDTFQAGFSTMGGSAASFSYPREEDQHPIDNPDHVEEAIAYAVEALEAAEKLGKLDYDQADASATKFYDVAVENYIDRFEIPSAALEDDDEDKPKAGRLKKVILYLYAIVERVFKTLFDFFSTHKSTARKLIPVIKSYIGHADSISASVASQLVIKDKSLMNALHIDGASPGKVHELWEQIAHNFQKQQQFSAVSETAKLVSAAKEKNYGRVMQEARALHDKLKAGIEEDMEEVDPGQMSAIFSEKKAPGNSYYATEAMFGQNHIDGVITDEVRDNGTFTYHCGIRRDSEVSLRVTFFPLLSPDEIRSICRTSLKVCEDVIRFARDEELLKQILRDASFAKTKEADQTSIVALRNVTALGQNSYIVHLRYTVRTMQSLLRWCLQSIKKYEEVKK